MYVVRDTVTGQAVSPDFWTRKDAEAAQGSSELLVVRENQFPLPRNLDMGLLARQRRRNQPFDPFGHWRGWVENMLAGYEYLYCTGSRALLDYFRGVGPRPPGVEGI